MSAPVKLPLSGRRIVVTRTREQASELAGKLSALGATVVELPVLRISREVSKQTLAEVFLEFGSYDWLVFTSANGVHHFFGEFFRIYDDLRSLGIIRVACVGEATAKAVSDLHLKVEVMPKKATAEALAEEMTATGSMDSAKVLVITGNLNRETLVTKLVEARAIVDTLQVYKTESVDVSSDPQTGDFRRLGADAVLFASSSSAQCFADQRQHLALEPGAKTPLYGSIGPQTSATLRAAGLPVDFEAATPGLDELVAALVKALKP
ncbi:MAG TPA: uroporphyrinogen-III synthase [Opitutaceae bacterium]|jgi:uroporphyrinogen-III synthase